MRLSLELDEALPSSTKDRRLLYYVDRDVQRVEELAKKLAEDLGVSEELVFSVDGFVVFARSAIEILREGEVIHVSHRLKETSSNRTPSSEEESSSDSSTSDSSSTSQTSESQQQQNARHESSKLPSTETEEDSTTSSSENSSPDENSAAKVATPVTEKKEVTPVTEKNRHLLKKEENVLPRDPLANWKSVSGSLAVGDVVMYKLIELSASWSPQETAWRYGEVEDFRSSAGNGKKNCTDKRQNSTVCLAPWPDRTVHPDPKHALKVAAEEKHEDNDDESPEKSLEVPQSDYRDDGRLLKRLSEFVDIRQVESAFVEMQRAQRQIAESKSIVKKRSPPADSDKNRTSVSKRRRRKKV